jgi:acyl carrier protein
MSSKKLIHPDGVSHSSLLTTHYSFKKIHLVKKLVYIVAILAIVCVSCEIGSRNTAEKEGEDTLATVESTELDETKEVRGQVGDGSSMNMLELVTEQLDTLNIEIPGALVAGGVKVGDEVDVIYTKEYGSLTSSIAINVTALQHLWTQRSSQGTQSIEISPKGVAATYNMPNIEYDHWSILNGRLLLHSPQKAGVESSGYTDTLDILMLTADTLVLGTENHQSKFWKEN